MISTHLREDRWFKAEQNAAELSKLLASDIFQEALAICREKAAPKSAGIALPDENGDSQREKAAAAFYSMAGYNKFYQDLCVLAGSIPDIRELSAPWTGPHIHSDKTA